MSMYAVPQNHNFPDKACVHFHYQGICVFLLEDEILLAQNDCSDENVLHREEIDTSQKTYSQAISMVDKYLEKQKRTTMSM